jgi:hypothetical protein
MHRSGPVTRLEIPERREGDGLNDEDANEIGAKGR